MASLDSVLQKIFRAAQHIKSLEAELEWYFKSNPGKMVREPNTPDDQAVFKFHTKGPIPARFGLITGDALQNIRSALDYLVWELVIAAKNQPSPKNMFPICSTLDAFEEQVSKRKRLDGVHPDAIAEIRALQPCHLGKDAPMSTLLVLDDLTNINKHRRVLLTQLGATDKPSVVVDKDGGFSLPSGSPTPRYDAEAQFGPYPIIDGKVHMNTHFVAVIAFGEGAAKGMEISMCLNEWAVYIKNEVVPKFERFFKS